MTGATSQAKEIAKQYVKYDGAATQIQTAWRGKKGDSGSNSNVLKQLEEQLLHAVDAAARNNDADELQRVHDFAQEEEMYELLDYIRQKQVEVLPRNYRSSPASASRDRSMSMTRSAPPPPMNAVPPPPSPQRGGAKSSSRGAGDMYKGYAQSPGARGTPTRGGR